MAGGTEKHGSRVHRDKAPATASSYKAAPGPSLRALDCFGAAQFLSFIDIGGGLPARRYDADCLAQEVGNGLRLLEARREDHVTPWGVGQSFSQCPFRCEGSPR